MEKFNPVSYIDVEIKEGFWKNRIDLNKTVTIYSVRDRFCDTGRFEAFKFNWYEGANIPKPHIFWDSDVAKWIESVAYILGKEDIPELRNDVLKLIALIEKNQCDDGYFNIFHTVVQPENRFRIRDNHELYCLGHFIEAAVAWKSATGCDRLINIVDKYIDLVIKIFTVDKSAGFVTPGHEEIELALIKLYRLTGAKKYLDLALFFINERGYHEEGEPTYEDKAQIQSHIPVRNQKEAMGHAVRACYLYAALADAAKETDDEELFNVCKTLFSDITEKKMYITGGIGSSHHGEAFTIAYDLPNDTAYAETCASIALMMFADRMKDIELDSRYADIVEKEIYNGIISGISLDGKAFFYENPLEVNLSDRIRHTSKNGCPSRLPITQRQEVFSCSCCPPNLTRFFGNIGSRIFSTGENTIILHQFIPCVAVIGDTRIEIDTKYPCDGLVKINVSNGKGKYIFVRIPGWCKKSTLSANSTDSNGYKKVFVDSDEFSLSVDFDMTPRFCVSNPLVKANAHKVAVMSGPVIYCMEHNDNPNINYWDVRLDMLSVPKLEANEYFDCNVITADAFVSETEKALYTDADNCMEKKISVRLIPYFGFANRGESDMSVWLNR